MNKNNLRIENHPVLGEYIKGKEGKKLYETTPFTSGPPVRPIKIKSW